MTQLEQHEYDFSVLAGLLASFGQSNSTWGEAFEDWKARIAQRVADPTTTYLVTDATAELIPNLLTVASATQRPQLRGRFASYAELVMTPEKYFELVFLAQLTHDTEELNEAFALDNRTDLLAFWAEVDGLVRVQKCFEPADDADFDVLTAQVSEFGMFIAGLTRRPNLLNRIGVYLSLVVPAVTPPPDNGAAPQLASGGGLDPSLLN